MSQLFQPQLLTSHLYEYDYPRYRMKEWMEVFSQLRAQEKKLTEFDLDTKTAIPFQAAQESYPNFLNRVQYEKWMLDAQNFLSSKMMRDESNHYASLKPILEDWDEVGFASHLTSDALVKWFDEFKRMQMQIESLTLWLDGIYYSRWFFRKDFQLPKEYYNSLKIQLDEYENTLTKRLEVLQKILFKRLQLMSQFNDFEHDECLLQIFLEMKKVGKISLDKKLPKLKNPLSQKTFDAMHALVLNHSSSKTDLLQLSWYQTNERAAIPFQTLASVRYPIPLGLFELTDKKIIRDTLLDCIKINRNTKQLKTHLSTSFKMVFQADNKHVFMKPFASWVEQWQALQQKIAQHEPNGWRKYVFFWRTLEVKRYQSVLTERMHHQIKIQVDLLFARLTTWIQSTDFLIFNLTSNSFEQLSDALSHLSGYLMLHTHSDNLKWFKQKEIELERVWMMAQNKWLKTCATQTVDALSQGHFERAHQGAAVIISFKSEEPVFSEILQGTQTQLDYEKDFQNNELKNNKLNIPLRAETSVKFLIARLNYLSKNKQTETLLALSHQIKHRFEPDAEPLLYFELLQVLAKIRTLTVEEHILNLNLAKHFEQKEIATQALNQLQELEPDNQEWTAQKKLLNQSPQSFFKSEMKHSVTHQSIAHQP